MVIVTLTETPTEKWWMQTHCLEYDWRLKLTFLPVNGSEFNSGTADKEWLVCACRWETCCQLELCFHLSAAAQSTLVILTKMGNANDRWWKWMHR